MSDIQSDIAGRTLAKVAVARITIHSSKHYERRLEDKQDWSKKQSPGYSHNQWRLPY